MGCDAHAVVQVKRGDKWETVEWPNRWFGKWEDEKEMTSRFHIGRDYDLFAILANVRNGSGFAGCDTGDGFEPLTDNRGLPEDFDLEEGYSHKGVWMGDHSHTWLTLAELEATPEYWNKNTKLRGIISAQERIEMIKDGRGVPENWCGGVSGPGIEHVTLEEMDRRIREGLIRDDPKPQGPFGIGGSVYTQFEWGVTYREAAAQLHEDILPKLRELDADPNNVRIVIGFDS